MAQLYKALGRNREFPMLEGGNVAASALNVNFEHPLLVVPNLVSVAGSGLAGSLPVANMRIREIYLVAEAVLTGANTNTVTINIRQWRAGSALSTLASVPFVSGTNLAVFTPFLMTNLVKNNNIQPGDVITVQSVNAGSGLATPAMGVFLDWDIVPANVV